MRELFAGMFADVVFFPDRMGAALVVLIAAVLLLTAGLLAKYIGKSKRNKKNREEEK